MFINQIFTAKSDNLRPNYTDGIFYLAAVKSDKLFLIYKQIIIKDRILLSGVIIQQTKPPLASDTASLYF